MKMTLSKIERDALTAHLSFAVLCAIVLFIPVEAGIGIKLFFLVFIYNLAIPVIGIFRKHKEWVNIWLFSFILSIFQVWPDWFLSAQLGILFFPEDGLFKIGTVSGYMIGLWTIPLFMIIFIGERFRERFSQPAAYMAVALFSLIVFGISEETVRLLPSWYAVNVTMAAHIAVYIIIPELILGLSAYYCYKIIQGRSHWIKLPAAFIIMLLYLGSAAFFYFFIEKVLLG